jgi:hypothetical protein
MQNRIKEINGDFAISNEKGTSVKIIVPLQDITFVLLVLHSYQINFEKHGHHAGDSRRS